VKSIPPTWDNIRAALSFVSPDLERDEWVKVGMAVKDGLGGDGFPLFDEWSKGGQSYNATDCRDAWKSFKPGGKTTIATLWKLAIDAGWKPDADAHQETEAERQERERKRKAKEAKDRAAVEKKAKQAESKAMKLWKAGTFPTADFPYLHRKGIQPVDTLREVGADQVTEILGYPPKSDGNPLAGRVLVVPVKIDGKLTTAELIDQDGQKAAIAGGLKSGGFWAAQPMPKGDGAGLVLAIGEGVATCLSVKESAGYPVFAALMASALPKVTRALRERYPAALVLVLGDVGNGLKHAEQAGKIKGAALAVPSFTPEQIEAFQHQHEKPPTDFNDLHQIAGPEVVRDQLTAVLLVLESKASPADAPTTAHDARKGGANTDKPPSHTPGKEPPKSGEIQPNGDDEEPKRPSYVVRDKWGRFGPPGVWFHGHKGGGKNGEPTPIDLWLCSPLHVEAVTCGDNGYGFGRLLRFRDTFGHWHTWAMPMALLGGSCEELRRELLDAGVHIDYQERARLADYLQAKTPKRRVLAATRTGWTRDGEAFVLPERVIGSEDVHFQAETLHQDGEAEQGGDFHAWKTKVAALCAGNPVLVLSVCVALAGPLLAKVGRDTGGIHWVGDSSTGKSTALHVACSVWGGESFRRTWKGTANGFEGVAAARNDTFLPLDEIGQANPSEVGEIVYMLGNETGKQRAHRVGSARAVYRWRVTVLSTGEKTLETLMAEAGKKPNAGQLVRLLSLRTAREHGAFDALHHFPTGRALADDIKRLSSKHYGHAGPAFIERLLRDGRDFGAALAEVESLPAFAPENSQEARVASRFALYGMAGELAVEWGILPWKEGEGLDAAAEGFRLWRETQGGGLTEDRQILQAVADFISRHGDARFSEKAPKEDDQRQPVVMHRAGWWVDVDDVGRVYLFTSEGLREAVKGHDFTRAVNALDKASWLYERGTGGKKSKATAIGKRRPRLYWILPGDMDE
jgi:putative DNA primase/helicase